MTQAKSPLKIGFTVDQLLKCGGIRVPLEYCRELSFKGHSCAIYAKGGDNDLNDWKTRYNARILPISALSEGVDALISVWWPMLDELLQYPAKKRFHLVQGQDKLSYPPGHDWLPKNYEAMHRTDYDYLAVSDWAGESCRDPKIIPNGVDTKFWKQPINPLTKKPFRILFESSTADPYKGRKEAMEIIKQIKEKNKNIEAWEITRNPEPTNGIFDNQIINPTDEVIRMTFWISDVLLKTTWFDGFGLPHLEAMACGLPVVTTKTGGNKMFCVHNYNCLMSEPKNIPEAVTNIQKLIDWPELRLALKFKGLQTAELMTWKKSAEKLEKFLISKLDR